MRVTPVIRAKLARMRRTGPLSTMLAAGLAVFSLTALAALFVTALAAPAFAEDVTIPYECSVRGGEVMLVPSEMRSYRVLGARERQIYSACDPAEPDQCRNYQVHRFDVDCGGSRVPWVRISEAAARLDGERVSVKRNQMMLELAPEGGPGGSRSRDGWNPDAPYGTGGANAVVSFPAGFAPAIGMKPVFTQSAGASERPPAASGPYSPPAAAGRSGYDDGFGAREGQGGEVAGWDTNSGKGWQESPRGQPLDREAETGWDADQVISGSEGAPKGASPKAETRPQQQAALAGSKVPGASYGTESVTSQQLPEIGARPSKTAEAKKAAEKKKAVEAEAKPKPVLKETTKPEAPKAEAVKEEAPKVEASKPETQKPEVVKAEPVKSEPPHEAHASETHAEASSAAKPEVLNSATAEPPHKTETAMLEPPKTEAAPQPEAPKSEPPTSETAAVPAAASAPPEAAAAAPQPAGPAQSAVEQPVVPLAVEAPKDTQVVAEATLKPEDGHSSIETSSISVAGQSVPLLPVLFGATAIVVLSAGVFLMMRRDPAEGFADPYVERDFGRVVLTGAGETGARLAGPSFELPMPEPTLEVAPVAAAPDETAPEAVELARALGADKAESA